MTSDVVLGIDLGTSSVRATLIGPDGCPIATATREYPVDSPHPGYSEQHPDTWWQSTCSAVSAALAAADGPEVCAISFSGQMHGTVLCNANDEPIRPAIIWSDQRSSREVTAFRSVLEPGRLAELTANPLAAGFQLATLLWLRGNEPESLDAARHVFLPKDWLRFRMTGVAATDPSDACSTLMFDTANRSWSETVIEASGIDGEKLPRVAESFELSGTLLPTAAHELGLREGVPVFVGAGDTPATAFGNGVVDPGTVQCTIGSGGQLIAPLGTPKYDAELRTHTFCHVPRDRWYAMAAILSAGLSLRWLRGCMFGTDAPSYAELSAMA
ncbi:MAG TPA: xylulokinase, partial [Firmicutes bacterium]|nr:xylulokinase [Bacillota bacterium]